MYERPGRGVYVTATKAVKHGAPAVENNLSGAAVKQRAKSWSSGYDATTYARIEVGEAFHIRTKGIHQFDIGTGTPGVLLAAAAKGAAVWIKAADNTLLLAADSDPGDLPFGRVVELVADNRGVPTGKIRIDLDQRDFATPAA